MKNIIFVIVNEHQHRVDLRNFFENKGHAVVSVATPIDAIKLLSESEKPHLIVTGGDFHSFSNSESLHLIKSEDKFSKIPLAHIDLKDQSTWEAALKHFEKENSDNHSS